MKRIDRRELKEMMDEGRKFTLVEVLPFESFKDYHLPGAINIPIAAENFDERIEAAAPKDGTVVVYCLDSDCDASPKAAKRMEALGFRDVLDYEAGKAEWRSAGLHTES
ncbi:rhodanese-like domain-containing protein [Limibaculum sp. M0105]|uniref:Rhodanese-like domain-containing protein n=1 Tax=Thermohalobaculum xanthum TaxID=2753746 RepID=A0A8J7SFI8_9RHOB|nr:rhodanese-like domain-containing protein [Thermohalobaculum xanthum]MBK0400156.1 rhodanese-like domain-containing protein [Thermohalobaculum xanthum]